MAAHRDTGIRSADMSLTQLYLANEVCKLYGWQTLSANWALDWP